ncbi:anaerobic C4-dicarboxylate transporter [Pedobacter nyackensis]|uniref:anaerobic C4-dicarboxylate transporter n=1 Tax=Pedobacter nyackensis TaxID=475255 RepID=UPI00292EF547|nr:anaerobic C4-dicarboxylate transporter [Pedobacter nyackensis]
MIWIQLAVLISLILVGARMKGIGLGIMGAVGLLIFALVFGLKPTTPPIDVMLIILSVVTAAAALQAAGGMDYMVSIAEKILRKNPNHITWLGPIVTYTFTLVAGTAHIIYSLLPIIAEVATKKRVRPERPLSISVIAAHMAITASPISAATVALTALIAPLGYELTDIIMVAIPATVIGVLAGAFIASRQGKDLMNDPEFLERLKDPEFVKMLDGESDGKSEKVFSVASKRSVYVFLIAVLSVVLFAAVPSFRPTFLIDGKMQPLRMVEMIELLMLSAAAAIVLVAKIPAPKVSQTSIFRSGAEAVVCIFGVAWMSDTYLQANMPFFEANLSEIVTDHPWTFAIALFVMSILLFSQAATVRALMPLGIALGIPGPALIAMFPAVNGDFIIPSYPTLVAAMGFDRTGTTRVGRFLVNHSFTPPGLTTVIVTVAVGFLIATILL